MLQNLTQISLVTGLQITEQHQCTLPAGLPFKSTESVRASLAPAEPRSVQLGSAAGCETEQQNQTTERERGAGGEARHSGLF